MVVNEDAVYGADGNGDMGGERYGKRHKGEPATPRAKRTREARGKRKGAKVEKTAKGDRGDEPMIEWMFVTTDKQGRRKMLAVRARATQPQAEVPSPPPRPPPAKPMVPRRILPHPDTNSHTAQPLVGHSQSTPNTLSISATQRGTLGELLAHQHTPPHMVFLLPPVHLSHSLQHPPPAFGGSSQLRHFLQPL